MKAEFKRFVIGFWVLFGLGVVGVIVLFVLLSVGALGHMPSFEELENPKSSIATEVISSDGKPIGRFYIENRSYAEYEDLSPYLVKALVATEDERFYEHSGIDIKSLGASFSRPSSAATPTQAAAAPSPSSWPRCCSTTRLRARWSASSRS